MSIKKRRSDTKCAGLSSDKWDELSERLRHTIIVAQDSANSNVEYFIMPGEQLFHSSPQGYDTSEPVGVPASSDNIAKSKTKETYHLIVHKKKGGGGFGVVYQAGMTTAGGQHSIDICLKQASCHIINSLLNE
ncbi:hypothetical protein EB796_000893 [Bugula neritina]|uniref:Uncharacterized protein n=1 Tax=Bugula neritina TaxID=10212 RepID=A0A7J7KRP5_BUGNE|nr:hypothetical protein EB796_000893 [Bugula neritina]